jgi:hypothetical protein
VEFPSRYYVLLFYCGDYRGVFRLSVKMYERVEYGSVDGGSMLLL